MKQNKSIFEIMTEIWKEIVAEDVLLWLDEKYDKRGRRRQEENTECNCFYINSGKEYCQYCHNIYMNFGRGRINGICL